MTSATRPVSFLLVLALLRLPAPQGCVAAHGAPLLDHVVLATGQLDALTRRMARLGFRFKAGRLHDDSLLNRHIKFADGSSLELTSLAGTPASDMARDYAHRIASGDQGAFAALTGIDPLEVRAAARQLGLPSTTTASGGWVFASFPGSGDAGAVFFAAGPGAASDPDSLTGHGNGATALVGAWVEGGPALGALLRSLGARTCTTARLPDGRTGERWSLARGSLVLVAPTDPARPPRVLGVELARDRHPGAPAATTRLLTDFWLVWR